MKRSFLRSFGFAVALVLWQIPSAQGQKDRPALQNILEKARNIADIKATGMPGFRLLGDVRIWVKKDAPTEGKYLLTWTPEGKWREEIAFKGYKRMRLGDGKQFWQVRSSDMENPSIFELDRLLNVRRELKYEEGDKLKRLHSEKMEGTDAECIRNTSSKGYTRTLCFDPKSGELLRYTPDTKSRLYFPREYSQFQQWAGKSFPRTLRGFNGKQPVIEVQLEEVKPIPQLPPDFFSPPKDASVWSDCADGEIWKVKDQVLPAYPRSAQQRKAQGTVILYAVIEDDGHVSNLRIALSAGTDLDQAAAHALSKWRYERTTGCLDSKGRTESLIEVNFSLEIDQIIP
jgi:TonB family protein